MFEKNKEIEFVVNLKKPEFDLACSFAWESVVQKLDIDLYGNAGNVENNIRSRDDIIIQFKDYKMVCNMSGKSHKYTFTFMVTEHE